MEDKEDEVGRRMASSGGVWALTTTDDFIKTVSYAGILFISSHHTWPTIRVCSMRLFLIRHGESVDNVAGTL
jgi:hypothetical protein